MFEVIATGENKNYGKKGEKIRVGDMRLARCIKKGWIKRQPIKYIGNASGQTRIKPICKHCGT